MSNRHRPNRRYAIDPSTMSPNGYYHGQPLFTGNLALAPKKRDGNRLGLRKRKRILGYDEHAKVKPGGWIELPGKPVANNGNVAAGR